MKSPILLLSAALFGHLFVLWLHGVRLWNTEHYSFFPFGLIAVGLIWYQRRDEVVAAATKANPAVVYVGIGMTVVTAVVATLLTSGFLGWLSWVSFLFCFAYALFGTRGTLKSLPVLVMLLAITPLPITFDTKLILNLQHLASLLASIGLDVFGVIHVRQGVVLVSTTQSFLAEEACSGVRSLFSTIAGIVFWGLLHRYPIWRHMLNLVQAVLWVVVYNAARIMAVVLVEDFTEFSIATGWKHDLVGFVVFFIIAGTVLSTDRLIRAFFPLNVSDEDSEDAPGPAIPNVSPASVVALPWRFPTSSMLDAKLVLTFVCLFSLVGLLGLRMFTLGPRVSSISGNLPAMVATALPEKVGTWNVTDFREVKRDRGDFQGETSFVWLLKSGDQTVSISVDGDWADYHDLGLCFSGTGWRVTRSFAYPSLAELKSAVESESSPRLTRLDMNRLSGEQAVGFFSSIDSKGGIVLPQSYWGNETRNYLQEKMVSQLREVFGLGRGKLLRETTFAPPVSTIQMVYYPKGPMDDATVDSLQKLYMELRKVLLRDKRFNGG